MEMKTKLLITGMALMVVSALVSAQNPDSGQAQKNPAGKGYAWVDTNKNGICDNFETTRSFYKNDRRMANAQAMPNRRGLKPDQGCCLAPGQGRGMGQGGRNFIDSDKNGICDFYEKSVNK